MQKNAAWFFAPWLFGVVCCSCFAMEEVYLGFGRGAHRPEVARQARLDFDSDASGLSSDSALSGARAGDGSISRGVQTDFPAPRLARETIVVVRDQRAMPERLVNAPALERPIPHRQRGIKNSTIALGLFQLALAAITTTVLVIRYA